MLRHFFFSSVLLMSAFGSDGFVPARLKTRSRISLSASTTLSNPSPQVITTIENLSTNLPMEVMSATPSSPASKPPSTNIFAPFFPPPSTTAASSSSTTKRSVVFVHGSFHSAWCWAEHFLPYFASQDYPGISISFRGTSGSPSALQETAIKITTHADDLCAYLIKAFEEKKQKPIVIGHSFGGAVLMKVLEKDPSLVDGVAFLCSVPPSGNGPMTSRFIKRDFILAMKIVLGFVLKKGVEYDWLCRELFFDPDLDADTLSTYMNRLKKDSEVGLDVKDFLQELPSLKADKQTGKAPWIDAVPHRLVLGAEYDKLVDKEGVEETAIFADTKARFLPVAHDVMLGKDWQLTADAILQWLKEI